ncbi:unnamed protein product [Rotaria magnacalcarata]|uniref:Uncharacterized protein n=1 Tax=Rotaria magnacalcarata TaxID=392030 RepID=A0A816XT93_9BILA|nr:unnamed protein product [Rotaria magnacalcarata]
MLIGSRIYEYDDVALNYIRPILSDMRSNHVSCQGLFNTPQNKRADYKRDNIDVKAILSNLEKKCLLKHGKFLKVGSRSIDSWIKILSVPTNDEEFLIDRVENGIIYSAFCCHIEYHTNSYIKNSKRFVIPKSLYNQKDVTFGGKCVFSIEVLLRYASDLINMVS